MEESWKAVVGYEGYYLISNIGQVRSIERRVKNRHGWVIRPSVLLRPVAHPVDGHLYVNLCRNSKGKIHKVHRLVLLAFVGPCPEGMECRHFPDQNPTNNNLDNLSWSTRTENQRDRVLNGTDERGEKSPNAKLKASDIPKIREMRHRGMLMKDIGAVFGVSHGAISHVLSGKQWKHIP